MTDAEADDHSFEDGVMHACPACGHPDWFHPEMAGEDGDSVWCAECAHPFGTWPELRSRLFPGTAMLAATLAKKP